ncbi:ROK family protein [Nocardioides sp. YIM 152588]|uniref:ROK family protein n=1 Tax=Nocardioides sp. YIM 152588 TaxID=3158259 RepID=UPI0032E51E1D
MTAPSVVRSGGAATGATVGLSVGIDIGATKMLGVAAGPDGRVVAEVRVGTPSGGEAVVAAAGAVVDALRSRAGVPLTGTVGVGVPGLVDAEAGTLTHAVNLGIDGDRFPLRDLLADRLGADVVVDNDVNAAALGAASVTGRRDLAYVSLGTGLAAAFVLEGRLRRGSGNAAGEIGHIPVDPAGLPCACGQRGCLETAASGSALAAAWPAAAGVPPAQSLFDAASDGDPAAIAVRDAFAARVADAVRLVALTVDAESIVLGGGVAQVGSRLHAAVAWALEDQAAGSEFLRSLDLAARLTLVPRDVPVAALGAALLGAR